MGNIAYKCLQFSSEKSLQCPETSKIPRARIAHKEKTLLEKQETADNKKNEKKTVPFSQPSFPTVPVTQPRIPSEIIIEILSWLPVKILVRLKCVCKQWYALIQDRHFIEKHISRANSVVHQHNRIVDTPAPGSWHVVCGCDGLLLEKSNTSYKYWIQNPATCQILELPDPHDGSFGITFSFIPSTGNYKLVCVYDNKEETGNEGCEVLTVGSDDSWRPLKIPNLHDLNKKRDRVSVVSAGAAVHCIRVYNVGSNIYEEVVSLDLETECFTITSLPQGLIPDWKEVWSLDWDGKLSLANRVKEDLYVFVLEDYKKHKWGEGKRVVPLGFMKENQEDMNRNLIPLIARGGDLWFWLKDKKIFAYNISTGTITHTVPAPEGYQISKVTYGCPPSLVTLKGMKPKS
uniref:F-box domain-containing protein n=1 Tax=Davidia involucrata TaxID=16924 RepID=A0A5B7BHY0_DAVIN